MKKIGLSSLIAGLLIANVAGADPVAVNGGSVFILSQGNLRVQTAGGSPIACGGLPKFIDANATDVVISDGNAFVTSINGVGEVSVTTVPVRSCLVPSISCDTEPTVDLNRGVLDIPCLEANGQAYHIIMNQRGNSMNWEVTGIEDSIHHHNTN
jgi:hypothetical protein